MSQRWKPIESAPQTGRTLLLGYWNSRGNWRTVRGQWMSAAYIAEFWEEPDDVEEGWFETSAESDDLPNCWPVTPSHWQPLPAAPCQTCNDQGAVGNVLTAQPCPDCTPPASAHDDAKDVEAVARAIWAIRREHEDRCDMELEDMGAQHPVWEEARAAVAAIAAQQGEGVEA